VAPKRSRGSVVSDREHVARHDRPQSQAARGSRYAEEYRSLALRAKDRRERECYERIVELYEEIAEELEALIDG
jgi:hypothetical protein